MPNPCYSGSNPIGKLTDQERLAMWRWIKEHAIDHGMPFEQVHEVFNNHFFGGSASTKPEWINEFLAARKTPFKRVSDAAWAAQANRRNIQQQAKHLVNDKNATMLERAFNAVIAGPRSLTLGWGVHSVVFPFTHGGALILNPLKWKAFARMVVNTWRNLKPAEAEILRDTMARNPRFTLGKRLGLDLSTHGNETGGAKSSDRTWGALVETRFRLWDAAMERHTRAGMSVDEIDSIGREMAVWANHATGSGEGPITAHPVISSAFFGPKLTQSYFNRLVGDPVKTLVTWSNWKNASAGEKVVAMQRFRGAMWAAGTYTGMLLANQAMLQATGQKDQINWGDPSQADWLAFKWGGMRWGIPGAMHAEIKLIGQIIAAQTMKPEDLAKLGIKGTKGATGGKLVDLREEYERRQAWEYLMNKATPAIKLEEELRTGYDWEKRPLPWSSDKGTDKKPPMSWLEYIGSKFPIPLSAASGYVYDQLRHAGASVTGASMWMRAAMAAAIGAISGTTGVDPKPIKEQVPQTPHRTRYQTQVGR
jgi:hypothetical protein